MEEDDEDDEEEDEKQPPSSSLKNATVLEDVQWAQCFKCNKWRTLGPGVVASSLHGVWTCSMNKGGIQKCSVCEEQ